MGATTFQQYQKGTDLQEAFNAAHDAAAWEYGHGGYTGTLAEKPGAVLFTPAEPITDLRAVLDLIQEAEYTAEQKWDDAEKHWVTLPRLEAHQARAELERIFPGKVEQLVTVYSSKWDEAVAFPYRDGFVFCGWASC